MEFHIIDILTQRIQIKQDDSEYQPSQLELDAELIIYNEELEAEIEVEALAQAISDYNEIKRESDSELQGDENSEEVLALIETIKREIVVIEYTDLTLVHTEKQEITLDMDSEAIQDLLQSLQSQEVSTIEVLRKSDLIARFDALEPDTRACMSISNVPEDDRPNIKVFRNKKLLEMDHVLAENLMVSLEASKIVSQATRQSQDSSYKTISRNWREYEYCCSNSYW